MKPTRLLPLALSLALVLTGCSSSEPPPAEPAASAAAPTPAPDAAEPAAPAEPPPPPPPAPVAVYDPAVIHFGGYRTAAFNSDADAVRAAHGEPLQAQPAPETPEACHYLLPEPAGDGPAFMIEGGKFVRVDINRADIVAPGGLAVGMSDVDVMLTFADTEQKPHKYTDGRYLVVKPEGGGPGRMVFEVDKEGTILKWRIGLEPHVHYVEGCS